MKKRAVSLFMAAAMTAGLLAGCGSTPDGEASSGNAGNSSDAGAPESEGAGADESESTGAEDTEAEGEQEGEQTGGTQDNAITLPLTEDPVTLSMWLPSVTNVMTIWGDYNSVPFFQEMEKRTGVHIEFETPVVGEETTAFNLMISSGELPDIICWPNYYSDGYDAAIDDGYYLDLTPYLDTYLSNYNALRLSNERWKTDSVTDSGRAATVLGLLVEPQRSWGGMQIRQDWLDDLNLDMPVTYSDLEEVLTAFKEEKGAYAPLALCSKGNYYYGEMSGGFGVDDSFMNKDGTVVAGFVTDEWRQYLTLMNQWYEKGLIDPDFMTNSSWMVDTELVTTGASGVWWSMYTMPAAYEATDENMVVSPLPSPKLNESDTVHFRMADVYDHRGVAISADCENVEIALKWLDYLFTEEGMALANYGPEGLTFNYDENGEKIFTDVILNNEDGLSAGDAVASYAMIPEKIPSYYDWTRELQFVPEKDVRSYDVWGSEDHLEDWVMPANVSLTSDESVELASMYADIQTYYQEASCQFITGVLDIENDADWENYVNVIEGMGIERCVEIRQAALDRYLAR